MIETKLTATLALLVTASLLSACAQPVSGDTSCAWTRPITVTGPQVDAMGADFPLWRPLAEQIVAHNDTRKARCS